MSNLFGNHIVGFPTMWLINIATIVRSVLRSTGVDNKCYVVMDHNNVILRVRQRNTCHNNRLAIT